MEQRRGCPIGIDLGTAYIRVAISDGTNFRLIKDEQGISAMPSYVAFTESGVLVGEAARLQAPHNAANTIFDVIRLIGRRYSHYSVQNDMRLWPFKVIAGPGEMLHIEVNWKGRLRQFSAVEICSMLLMRVKENAMKDLGTMVNNAVITVPVCFNYAQRQAIRQAGAIVGLNVMQIINAPAASSFLYGLGRLYKSVHNSTDPRVKSELEEHNMVIFDLGAGTLDVAVVTIKDVVCRVRATAGDVHLGGSDFDNNLVNYFLESLKKKRGEDLSYIPMVICKLRSLCEMAKISLSSGSNVVPMKIASLYNDVNFETSITEANFNDLNNDLFIKCKHIMEACLRDSKINVDAVNEVILSGSSARIPLVKKHIQSCFKSKVLTINQYMEAATAYGAAFQAFFLSCRGSEGTPRLSLLDATPFSLGLRSLMGIMNVFVPKNMNIPFKIENIFPSNTRPHHIEVYEGEGTLDSENNFIGKCELPESHISSDFLVSFQIHENGILAVTVKEITHGKIKTTIFTHTKIENSQNRAQEAFFYKERGKGVKNAFPTKSLTITGTSYNQDKGKDTKPDEHAIGIDFGTTYSCVAVWRRNHVEIIENEYGSKLTSSVVAFTDSSRLIGDKVKKEQLTTSPANTIPNIKRLIGRLYTDQSVQNDNKFLPFRVLCGDKNRPIISVQYKNEEKHFAPEEIVAMIFSKMREIAETHLNSKVTKAVISVPASFNDSQRKAIKDAGAIAGLSIMQLLNEPSATSIAYFLQKNIKHSSTEKTLLIFDLGGGNLDVSIVKIKEGNIKVQAVGGCTNLGGEDFDNNMVSYFVENLMKEKKKDIRNKPRSLRKLRIACEKAKRVLSTNAQTAVETGALDGDGSNSLITRKAFEVINAGLFKRCIDCVKKCLEDAKMDKNFIDEVVLVGGSTRIPKMQQLLQEFFNGRELCRSLNVDEAVAYGAAIQAAILSGNIETKEFNILKLQDVTSLSLGMSNKDGAMMNLLVRKHTPIPAKKDFVFTNCTDGLSSCSIQVQECELASTIVFSLSGITPKSRGTSEIIVSFKVDDSGILNLTAKDMSTKEKNNIVINKENGALTAKEIHKMIEAAACYKIEDEQNKKRAVALYSLENFAYQMKAAIANEVGVSTISKKSIEEAADNTLAWLKTNYLARIDEISVQRKKLETIKSQIVYLGTDASL